MANLMSMDLPSSDEDDDDYDAAMDNTGEREDRPGAASKKKIKKRGIKRG